MLTTLTTLIILTTLTTLTIVTTLTILITLTTLFRQMLRPFRKPLIVMSPKTLLRLPQATSSIESLLKGKCFIPLFTDDSVNPTRLDLARRLVLFVCLLLRYDFVFLVVWQKWFFALERSITSWLRLARKAHKRKPRLLSESKNWSLSRLNKSRGRSRNSRMPNISFGSKKKAKTQGLGKTPNVIVWIRICGFNYFQMWCRSFIQPRFISLGRPLEYIGRPPCAASAVGLHELHDKEQKDLFGAIFWMNFNQIN